MRICGAQRLRQPGVYCRKRPCRGSLRCRHHGGPGSGIHHTDDAHHSRSIAIALAARRGRPQNHDRRPEIGGMVRAATAARGPDGRFLPNPNPPPKRTWAYREQQRALAIVIQLERAAEAGLITFEPL